MRDGFFKNGKLSKETKQNHTTGSILTGKFDEQETLREGSIQCGDYCLKCLFNTNGLLINGEKKFYDSGRYFNGTFDPVTGQLKSGMHFDKQKK